MNERIKELAREAGMNIVDDKFSTYGKFAEKFAELLIREYSYDVMNLHGAKPESVQYAAKCWGVEV